MRHDVLVFFPRERTFLVQHRLPHADLADVVELPAHVDRTDDFLVEF